MIFTTLKRKGLPLLATLSLLTASCGETISSQQQALDEIAFLETDLALDEQVLYETNEKLNAFYKKGSTYVAPAIPLIVGAIDFALSKFRGRSGLELAQTAVSASVRKAIDDAVTAILKEKPGLDANTLRAELTKNIFSHEGILENARVRYLQTVPTYLSQLITDTPDVELDKMWAGLEATQENKTEIIEMLQSRKNAIREEFKKETGRAIEEALSGDPSFSTRAQNLLAKFKGLENKLTNLDNTVFIDEALPAFDATFRRAANADELRQIFDETLKLRKIRTQGSKEVLTALESAAPWFLKTFGARLGLKPGSIESLSKLAKRAPQLVPAKGRGVKWSIATVAVGLISWGAYEYFNLENDHPEVTLSMETFSALKQAQKEAEELIAVKRDVLHAKKMAAGLIEELPQEFTKMDASDAAEVEGRLPPEWVPVNKEGEWVHQNYPPPG